MIYSVICDMDAHTFLTWVPTDLNFRRDYLSFAPFPIHSETDSLSFTLSLPPSLPLSLIYTQICTHTHAHANAHTAYSSFALWQSSLILILKSSEIMALYLLPVSAGLYLYQWSVEQDEVSEYTEISFCWLTFISVAEYSHLQKFSPWNLGVLCPPMISLNYSAKAFSVKWSLLTNPQKFSHFVCHPSLLLNFFILFDTTLNLSRSPECA